MIARHIIMPGERGGVLGTPPRRGCRPIRNSLTTFILALSLSIGIFTATAESELPQHKTISGEVRHIMQTLEKGEFVIEPAPFHPIVMMGDMFEHPSGHEISRTQLQMQTDAIVPYGVWAVPELLEWLNHKDTYMRYIAVHSLGRITKVQTTWYHFKTPGESVNGDAKWFENARDQWRKWYMDAVTNNPLQKPKDQSKLKAGSK